MTDDKGIACRKCGCRHLYVLRTRRAPGDRIQRVRRCRNCGRQLVTVEKAAGATIAADVDDLTHEQRDTLLTRLLQLLSPFR